MFHVLFDFDDTLYNFTESDKMACSKVFTYISESFSVDKNTVEDIYKKVVSLIKKSNNINNKHDKEIYFKKVCEYMGISIHCLPAIMDLYDTTFYRYMALTEGTHDLLLFLSSHNIQMGIVSNNKFRSQYKKLCILKISHFFSYITTTDEVGEEKPHPTVMMNALHKFSSSKQVIMVGDNFDSDVRPCFEFGMTPFLMSKDAGDVEINTTIDNHHYFKFGTMDKLHLFIESWINADRDLRYLSGYFSQSTLCVQGTGGNISVKVTPEAMVIKPSGSHMGDLMNTKIEVPLVCRGKQMSCATSQPSMESPFHEVLNHKYVVHLHFIPVNTILCSEEYNENELMNMFPFRTIHIPYCHPGKPLAESIQEKYQQNQEVDLILLRNHGIILCARDIQRLYSMFATLCHHVHSRFHNELSVFSLHSEISDLLENRFLHRIHSSYLHGVDPLQLISMRYCFPDLCIFLTKVTHMTVASEDRLQEVGDLLITNDKHVFIVSTTVSKFYAIREVLESYCILLQSTTSTLSNINENIDTLCQDPLEVYRKGVL